MRIAIAISQVPPITSGVARIAARMESGLQKLGCQVDIFSTSELHQLKFGEFRVVNILPIIQKLLKQGPYDIINIYGPVPTFSDLLLLLCRTNRQRLCGARIVYTHIWDIDISKITSPFAWIYNTLTRILAKQADMIITSSKAHSESFSTYTTAEKRRVIPWGVDDFFIRPTIPRKADEFTILFVGQLRPYKGVDVLLKASTLMRDCKIVIVGEGHCRNKYLQLTKSLNLPNVTFTGRISDDELRKLYAISHVIVLPSVSQLEAFGIVLLEGMGAGCVPVASNLPGVTDTVADSGLTFGLGDASSLARILILLKNDQILLNQLSQKAWARAKTFSWEATCQDYLSAFSGF